MSSNDPSRDSAGALSPPQDIVARKATDVSTPGSDLYSVLVESVRDYAIFALDPEGYILTWNRGAERLKGWTREEIVGRHFSISYPHEAIASRFPWYESRRSV